MAEDRCVCCGEIIPEGRMVCPSCMESNKEEWTCQKSRLTNLEIIKLFAEKKPELLAEFLDDIYCIAFNDGNMAAYTAIDEFEETIPEITEEWLNSEYDRDWFRESDVEELL